MKKSISVIAGSILLIISLFTCLNINKTDVHKEENDVPKVTHRNMLSMMLETDSCSGEYTLEERSSWPTKEDGYIFNSTLSKCENGSKLSWNSDNGTVVFSGNMSDKCYVYFDVYVEPTITLADYVKSLYTGTQGENNLYYHDSTLANGAGDNSYRYAGSSETTNNYVCFGSDADTCPNDNLYRIIGVFDGRVRLIKEDYANSDLLGTDTSDYYGTYSATTPFYKGDSSNLTNIAGYHWNNANYSASNTATGYYNDWSYSELNKTHLNKNFLENIGSTWANMIDTTTWKVGGFETVGVVPSTVYTNEITSPSTQVTSTYDSKVGLMYVSDYAFAAAPSAWTKTLYNYGPSDNWMYMGLDEWTMARSSSDSNLAYIVEYSGCVTLESYGSIVNIDALGARPVFHLTSKVEVIGGDGTLENPLKIRLGN